MTPPTPPDADPAATVHRLATGTHGRYLVAPAETAGPAPLLVGFHGYAETAERHLAELDRIPGSRRWTRVAVQALHRFYSESRRHVVGSWMTRQDREIAIADNLAYVDAVVEAAARVYAGAGTVVYCGFSQGVAMAYRAALLGRARGDGVIALAGDVPPELADDDTLIWPPVLIGRGRDDTWYTPDKLDADLATLAARDITVDRVVFDGGHEWAEPFREAAGRFLVERAERAAAAEPTGGP